MTTAQPLLKYGWLKILTANFWCEFGQLSTLIACLFRTEEDILKQEMAATATVFLAYDEIGLTC